MGKVQFPEKLLMLASPACVVVRVGVGVVVRMSTTDDGGDGGGEHGGEVGVGGDGCGGGADCVSQRGLLLGWL